MHRRYLTAVAAALLVLALPGVAGAAAGSDALEFPRPGGGPRVIDSYVSVSGVGDQTFLLDTRSGTYRQLPFVSLTVSPDRRAVAV